MRLPEGGSSPNMGTPTLLFFLAVVLALLAIVEIFTSFNSLGSRSGQRNTLFFSGTSPPIQNITLRSFDGSPSSLNQKHNSLVKEREEESDLHLKQFRTYHMCHSRDEAPSKERRASCRFRNLCTVADNSSNQGVSWIYIDSYDHHQTNDGSASESINFSLGIGPHQVDERLMVRPTRMSFKEFIAKYQEINWQSGTSIIYHEYNFENFGHALTDQLMPIYFLQRSFGFTTNDIYLYEFKPWRPVGTNCDWQILKRTKEAAKSCNKFRKMFLPVVSRHQVRLLNSHLNETEIPLCFKDVMVGMQMLSDDCMEGSHGRKPRKSSLCNHGKQIPFWEFREYLLNHFDITCRQPSMNRVVIWNANPRRRVKGLEDYAKVIQERFNVTAEVVDWSKMDIKDQLRVICNTTVHITTPGGGSHIAIFLPRGATTIRLFTREYLLEHHFFRYLSYIITVELHVIGSIDKDLFLKEVKAAIDRYSVFNQQ